MTTCGIVQDVEIKFWKVIIQVMADEGILMKTLRTTKKVLHGKALNVALLVLVWAAIGFVSGMLIGRVLLILQLL